MENDVTEDSLRNPLMDGLVGNPLSENEPLTEGVVPETNVGGARGSSGLVNSKGQPICGARGKRSGKPCACTVLFPNGRCKVHGGPTPAGMASPHFIHGQNSKYLGRYRLPEVLADKMTLEESDEDLISLKNNIKLLDIRFQEILGRMGEAKQVPWKRAVQQFNKILDDPTNENIEELGRLLNDGKHAADVYEESWKEIRELTQERTVVSKAESSRMQQLETVLTLEQAVALIHGILSIARDTIGRDEKIFNSFNTKVLTLLPKE